MTKTEIALAENIACGEDFCFVCSRATDHFGEHSKAQIVAWTERPSIMQSIFVAKAAEL